MKNTLYILFIFFPLFSFCQTLEIKELWENPYYYATYQQNNISYLIKKQELIELKSNRLPLVYADGNIQRNLIIPTTPVPAIAFDPSAQDGVIIPLKFATKWSSKAGIQAEWNIFEPKKNLDEKQKELEIEQSNIQKYQSIQEWRINATLAYASIVLASLQYDNACQDTLTYLEILKINEARFKEGRLQSAEYLNTQQEYQRKLIEVYNTYAILQDANLEFQKYYFQDSIKSLNSNIDDIIIFLENYKREDYDTKSLDLERKINSLNIQSTKKQTLPTITLNGYLGEQFFSNKLNVSNSNEWYGNSNVNMSLRIPISKYITSTSTLKKLQLNNQLITSKIEENNHLNKIKEKQKQAKIDALKNKIRLLENIKAMAQQHNKDQYVSYIEGRILLTEYNQSIINYKKAKLDIWESAYELIKAYLD